MFSSRFTAIVAALLLLASSLNAQTPGRKLALLVGVQKYDFANLNELKYAENDVVELGQVLRDNGFQVVVMCDGEGQKDSAREPKMENIRKQLSTLVKGGRRSDTVIVALSGHGVQFQGDSENYFCPSDARPTKEKANRENLLAMSEIMQTLSDGGIGVKMLLVDACRNDPAQTRGIDGNSIRPPKGGAIMFACSRDQRAFESAKHKHGVFFHYVLKGLRGEADNGRGEVTWNSLADYVSTQVPDDVARDIGEGARQEPNVVADISGRSPSLARVKPIGIVTKPAESAVAVFRKGRELIEKDQVEAAHETFEKAVALEPNNAEFLAWRGYTFTRRGDFGRAERDADDALKIDGNCSWAWNTKAIVANGRRDPREAIRLFEKAANLDPNVHYFIANLGFARAQVGDAEQGLRDLNKAVELNPNYAFCYYFRGLVQYRRGQVNEGMKDINKAIEMEPKRGQFHRDRALGFIKLGNFEEALKASQTAVELGSFDAETFLYRGMARHGTRRFEEAMVDYTKSLKMNSENAETWKYRGMLHAKNQSYQNALADFDESIKRFSNDAEVLSERGAVYYFLNQQNKALTDLNSAIELSPREPLYYRVRAKIFDELRRANDAQRDRLTAEQLAGK